MCVLNNTISIKTNFIYFIFRLQGDTTSGLGIIAIQAILGAECRVLKIQEECNKQVTDLQNQLRKSKADFETFQAKVKLEGCQAELDARKAELAARKAELAAHQAKLDAEKAQLDARNAQLAAGRAKSRAYSMELALLKASLESTTGEREVPEVPEVPDF